MNTDATLLDTKLLRLFDALYRTGSVTRAAEQLDQSQPTVSIWLARLREELADPLFVRTAAGMQPTPRAEALIGDAREALAALRRLGEAQREFDPATETRRFRICMTDASHVTLLPQLLAHVRAAAPGVQLEALRIDAHTAVLLQSGEADLALGLVPGLEAGFYQQTLFAQDWVCLLNPRHPRVGATFSLSQYADEAHVAISSGTGNLLLENALKAASVERRVVLALPGFLGLVSIIATTDLIATLPRQIGETLAQMGDLRVLAPPLAIAGFTVKQHWHARFHHDPANRWLRGVCWTLFGRSTPT
ncbi:MAG: LysR family transcriptional regulator [Leptothrix sp. (in: b-proteobacteria)]